MTPERFAEIKERMLDPATFRDFGFEHGREIKELITELERLRGAYDALYEDYREDLRGQDN